MSLVRAEILPSFLEESSMREAIGLLARLNIHCEAKDFGRPPPLLAALYELFVGKSFEGYGGKVIQFHAATAASGGGSGEGDGAGQRTSAVWMRIDTRYGDLASGSGRRIKLPKRLNTLPSALRTALAAGKTRLVLDWSHEGHPVFWTSNIRKIIEPYGIAPDNVIILSQNIAPPEPAAIGEEDLRIVNAHAFIPDFWRLCFGKPVRRSERNIPFGFAAHAPAKRRFHTITLNEEATATRALLAALLEERPKPGILTFRKDQFRRNLPGSEAFRAELQQVSLDGHWISNQRIVDRFLSTRRHYTLSGQAEDDAPRSPGRPVSFLPIDALCDSALHVVTEREVGRPDQQRFTEKTLKAVIAGNPFVVFGNQKTIEILTNAGFNVLPEFVDHSYDTLAEPAARFAAAFEQVERYLAREPSFTAQEHERLAAASAHNREVFRHGLFNKWVAEPLANILRPPVGAAVDAAAETDGDAGAAANPDAEAGAEADALARSAA